MAGILAAGVAPAVIGSGILMPIKKLWTPEKSFVIGGAVSTEYFGPIKMVATWHTPPGSLAEITAYYEYPDGSKVSINTMGDRLVMPNDFGETTVKWTRP